MLTNWIPSEQSRLRRTWEIGNANRFNAIAREGGRRIGSVVLNRKRVSYGGIRNRKRRKYTRYRLHARCVGLGTRQFRDRKTRHEPASTGTAVSRTPRNHRPPAGNPDICFLDPNVIPWPEVHCPGRKIYEIRDSQVQRAAPTVNPEPQISRYNSAQVLCFCM